MKGIKLITFALSILVLASCGSTKEIIYLQDMVPGFGYPTQDINEVTIQPGDKLHISVTCKNPELALPFNANAVTVGADGTATSIESGMDYRVDPSGNIDFPILGEQHVADLTLTGVRDHLKEGIINGGYIKDPIVNIELLNLRYTVLGAVGSVGTFTTSEGRITLLEAIANAGDITAAGRVDKVSVIREEDGGRTMYVHDLRSKDLFDSPCYYLQQNDIVYVEPKYLAENRKESKAWQIIGTTLSAISVTAALIIALTR